VSPSPRNERLKKLVARLVEGYTEELESAIMSTGSTTFKDQLKERGLEPDESYYVKNEPRVRNKEINLAVDPPPDLAIEIDLQRSRLDKLGLYAAFGIPEVWSHDGQRIVIRLLGAGGAYAVSERSAAFPELPIGELNRFLDRLGSESETQLVRAFREWVRKTFGAR